MDTLITKSSADLVEMIIDAAKAQQSWAVKCAKGVIALVAVTGSEAEARATLKKAKLSDCHVKNAMQLVWAYDAVVKPGHAPESWFDELLYLHAVEVRRAIAKVGVKRLVELGLFAKSAKANLIEFELIADTGLSRVERIAKDEADAMASLTANAKKAEKVKAADPTPAAPADVAAPASPPATISELASLETAKPGKGKKTAIEQFDNIIATAEKFIGSVFPTADEVTIETMKNRVAALMVVIDATAKAQKDAALKSA